MLLRKQKPLKTEIEGFQLESRMSVNFLEITIDHFLIFDTYGSNICKTARAKVKTLRIIRNALDENQAKLLYNSFILSQFNYCSIIWIFFSKASYKKIKEIQEKRLPIVYNEPHMSLEEPLMTKELISVGNI